MKADDGPDHDKEEVRRLKQELDESDELIQDLRSKLESQESSHLEADLDKAQKFVEDEKRRSEDYLMRLKYLQADFENYRKRVDRELHDAEFFSSSSLLKKLLPVLDDLDLAVSSAESNPDDNGLLEGVAMVRKNLGSVLQSEGLETIDALGKPFDPALHQAVQRVDGKSKKEDTVIGEMRKGYIFKSKVLRPSMVKVESAVKNNGEIE